MSKYKVLTDLNFLQNYFIIAIAAALLRILFSKGATFRESLAMFVGGTIFGTVIGYIAEHMPAIKPLSLILDLICGLIGKEIVNFCKNDLLGIVKNFYSTFIDKFKKNGNGNNTTG